MFCFLEYQINSVLTSGLSQTSHSFAEAVRNGHQRLRSSWLIQSSVTAVVDLLGLGDALLDGEGVSILAAVTLSICDGFLLGFKLGGREGWD